MKENQVNSDLHAYAKTFPSQGGVEIGPWLEKYAAAVPQGSAIVELGCWLGAGTAYLALGAMKSGAIIYTFDRWKATAEEVEKAKNANPPVPLREGDDTLPLVDMRMRKFPVPFIFVHGRIQDIQPWKFEPIGLYVDDATKVQPLWDRAMRVFKPHFIPGKTILVLMDYNFDKVAREQGKTNWQNYSAQRNYLQACASEFELVEDGIGGTTAAVFRYLSDK